MLADRELPDAGVRVDREPVALAELPHLSLDRARVDPELAPLAACVAENQVLDNGEPVDQPEVLVNHADTGVHRVAGRAEVDAAAVQLDLALVGTVESVEDAREGGLPGAVLA